jgi:hypothetical protein
MKAKILLLVLLSCPFIVKSQVDSINVDVLSHYLNGTWCMSEYHCWEDFVDTVIRKVEFKDSLFNCVSICKNDTLEVIEGICTLSSGPSDYQIKIDVTYYFSTYYGYKTVIKFWISQKEIDFFLASKMESIWTNPRNLEDRYGGIYLFKKLY